MQNTSKDRTCLMCGKLFKSAHSGNRIGPCCQSRYAHRSTEFTHKVHRNWSGGQRGQEKST